VQIDSGGAGFRIAQLSRAEVSICEGYRGAHVLEGGAVKPTKMAATPHMMIEVRLGVSGWWFSEGIYHEILRALATIDTSRERVRSSSRGEVQPSGKVFVGLGTTQGPTSSMLVVRPYPERLHHHDRRFDGNFKIHWVSRPTTISEADLRIKTSPDR
jgi:hypothetical protein